MLDTLFLEEGLNIPINKFTPSIGTDLLDFKACRSFKLSYEGFYFLCCVILVLDEFFPAFSAVIINNNKGIVVAFQRVVKWSLEVHM